VHEVTVVMTGCMVSRQDNFLSSLTSTTNAVKRLPDQFFL